LAVHCYFADSTLRIDATNQLRLLELDVVAKQNVELYLLRGCP
jgi:hypothetical protein